MTKSLIDGNKWRYLFKSDEDTVKSGFSPMRIADFSTETVRDATLPGCFEYNLFLSGVMPDPYYSDNIFSFRKYEIYHQWYFTTFDCDLDCGVLRFERIDTVADIMVNGKIVGRTDNAFVPHEFVVNGLKRRGNELVVHIYPNEIAARSAYIPAMAYAMKYAYPSLALRRPAAYYGWDIFPRLACGGIVGDVTLSDKKDEKINEFYLYTANVDNGRAQINLYCNLTLNGSVCDYSVEVSGKCVESEFRREYSPWHTAETTSFFIDDVRLWNPRGYGEPYLYEVKIRLKRNGVCLDELETTLGVRTVKLNRTASVDDANAKFEFEINGKKVFLLGTNWVPVDALGEDYKNKSLSVIKQVEDVGCNAVRVWGGGLYEPDEFYDYCDRRGIMVWQDFMTACGKYTETDDFAKTIAAETETAVKRLRNHPSIILWAGDNEGDIAHNWNGFKRSPVRYRITRDVIPAVLRDHDVLRPYLASSPCIENDEVYAAPDLLSEDHVWGPRDYFKSDYYKNSRAFFVSETGYHGCPSPASLAKFLSRSEDVYVDNRLTGELLAHASCAENSPDSPYAYRIGLMRKQAETLFGRLENLNDFVRASQISQAEADKYFIERMRIKRNTCGGIVWWNIRDGWPQISDAVIDFYGVKKIAYGYIKRSQSPICLIGDETENSLLVYAVNDTDETFAGDFTVTEIYSGRKVFCGKAECEKYSSKKIAEIAIDKGDKSFYLFEWECGGKKAKNHFHTGVKDLSLEKYSSAMKEVGFDLWEGF